MNPLLCPLLASVHLHDVLSSGLCSHPGFKKKYLKNPTLCGSSVTGLDFFGVNITQCQENAPSWCLWRQLGGGDVITWTGASKALQHNLDIKGSVFPWLP